MVFLKSGDFGIFFIFPIFGGDFGMILVEKNVWSFLVEKMGSPASGSNYFKRITQRIPISKPLSPNSALTTNSRKTYCKANTCNKCLTYLHRCAISGNIEKTTDQLWVLCSAVAYQDNCCTFNSGPTLFTY